MKILAIAPIAIAAVLAGATAQAETLDNIKSTGIVRMGVRTDTGSLSYQISEGKFGGFHPELCGLVVRDLEKSLGKKLQTQFVPVTSQGRIPSIVDGKVDMECGVTTNNQARQQHVAFAVTTFVEEVRAVVRANSGINSIAQLNGKTVATTAGTTSLPLLRKQNRAANVEIKEVVAPNDVESFGMLTSGTADVYIMDSQIVAAFVANSAKPSDFKLLPEVLSVEPIAIMLPKNSPEFKKQVDESLKALMRSSEIQKVYNKWFVEPIPPKNLSINLPASEATKKAWAAPNDRPVETY